MYIGRIVCVGRAADGRWCAAYRVSSRSFPNRTAVALEAKVSVVPKPGHEADVQKNPYIAYNCVRLVGGDAVAVVTNGSHTDPIAEKIALGMPVRDAMALSLLALDYEKDAYDTPRIASVADTRGDGAAWLGIVRENGVNVRRIDLKPGEFWYVATYEENSICGRQSGEFTPGSAEEACAFMLGGGVFAERTNPVTAVAAMQAGAGFDLHIADAPQ